MTGLEVGLSHDVVYRRLNSVTMSTTGDCSTSVEDVAENPLLDPMQVSEFAKQLKLECRERKPVVILKQLDVENKQSVNLASIDIDSCFQVASSAKVCLNTLKSLKLTITRRREPQNTRKGKRGRRKSKTKSTEDYSDVIVVEEYNISNADAGTVEPDCKKFRCTECEKSFARKVSLNHHVFTKHGTHNMVQCSQCKKWLLDECSLASHIKFVHPLSNGKPRAVEFEKSGSTPRSFYDDEFRSDPEVCLPFSPSSSDPQVCSKCGRTLSVDTDGYEIGKEAVCPCNLFPEEFSDIKHIHDGPVPLNSPLHDADLNLAGVDPGSKTNCMKAYRPCDSRNNFMTEDNYKSSLTELTSLKTCALPPSSTIDNLDPLSQDYNSVCNDYMSIIQSSTYGPKDDYWNGHFSENKTDLGLSATDPLMNLPTSCVPKNLISSVTDTAMGSSSSPHILPGNSKRFTKDLPECTAPALGFKPEDIEKTVPATARNGPMSATPPGVTSLSLASDQDPLPSSSSSADEALDAILMQTTEASLLPIGGPDSHPLDRVMASVHSTLGINAQSIMSKDEVINAVTSNMSKEEVICSSNSSKEAMISFVESALSKEEPPSPIGSTLSNGSSTCPTQPVSSLCDETASVKHTDEPNESTISSSPQGAPPVTDTQPVMSNQNEDKSELLSLEDGDHMGVVNVSHSVTNLTSKYESNEQPPCATVPSHSESNVIQTSNTHAMSLNEESPASNGEVAEQIPMQDQTGDDQNHQNPSAVPVIMPNHSVISQQQPMLDLPPSLEENHIPGQPAIETVLEPLPSETIPTTTQSEDPAMSPNQADTGMVLTSTAPQPCQTYTSQIQTNQTFAPQIKTNQILASQIQTGLTTSPALQPNQILASQIPPNPVLASQVQSNQTLASQIRMNQMISQQKPASGVATPTITSPVEQTRPQVMIPSPVPLNQPHPMCPVHCSMYNTSMFSPNNFLNPSQPTPLVSPTGHVQSPSLLSPTLQQTNQPSLLSPTQCTMMSPAPLMSPTVSPLLSNSMAALQSPTGPPLFSPMPRPSTVLSPAGSQSMMLTQSSMLGPQPRPSVLASPTQQSTLMMQPTQQSTLLAQPSQQPTLLAQPTQQPTLLAQPTQQPTLLAQPTQQPTLLAQPTQQPTLLAQPTQQPTLLTQPTQQPTLLTQPTQQPTLLAQPTQQPTMLCQQMPQPTVPTVMAQQQQSPHPSVITQAPLMTTATTPLQAPAQPVLPTMVIPPAMLRENSQQQNVLVIQPDMYNQQNLTEGLTEALNDASSDRSSPENFGSDLDDLIIFHKDSLPKKPTKKSNKSKSSKPTEEADSTAKKKAPSKSKSKAKKNDTEEIASAPMPVLVDESAQCQVCSGVAKGTSYGGRVCSSCKIFFSSTVKSRDDANYTCGNAINEACIIRPNNRKNCMFCRFQKCLSVGMAREAVFEEIVAQEEKANKRKRKSSSKPPDDSTEAKSPDDSPTSEKPPPKKKSSSKKKKKEEPKTDELPDSTTDQVASQTVTLPEPAQQGSAPPSVVYQQPMYTTTQDPRITTQLGTTATRGQVFPPGQPGGQVVMTRHPGGQVLVPGHPGYQVIGQPGGQVMTTGGQVMTTGGQVVTPAQPGQVVMPGQPGGQFVPTAQPGGQGGPTGHQYIQVGQNYICVPSPQPGQMLAPNYMTSSATLAPPQQAVMPMYVQNSQQATPVVPQTTNTEQMVTSTNTPTSTPGQALSPTTPN